MSKVLFVLEYDIDGDDLEEIAERILANVAIVSEDGARPAQAHLLDGLTALKILSIIKTEEDDATAQGVDPVDLEAPLAPADEP